MMSMVALASGELLLAFEVISTTGIW